MKTYATGGIVDSDNLLDEIKKHGDDTIVGVKTGEGILTPVQTAQFDELVKSLPDLNYAANMMKDIVKAPDMSNLVPVNNIGGDISIDLGGIVMNGVNDPEEFQKQIISAFQNSQKVQKVARAATTDLLAGKGRLGVQRIR
jgi:hypothetical protein